MKLWEVESGLNFPSMDASAVSSRFKLPLRSSYVASFTPV
jgi:hypothetical protein